MRKYLFQKAKYLLEDIKQLSETDYSISFKVGEFHTILKYKNHRLIAICSCKAGSLNQPCAHIMAAISKLTIGKNENKNNT